MSDLLSNKGVTTVQRLLEVTGVEMNNAVTLARRPEVQLVQVVSQMLKKSGRLY